MSTESDTPKPDNAVDVAQDAKSIDTSTPPTAPSSKKQRSRGTRSKKAAAKQGRKGIGLGTMAFAMVLAMGGAIAGSWALHDHVHPQQAGTVTVDRIASLEARLEALKANEPADLSPILSRLDALEARTLPDIGTATNPTSGSVTVPDDVLQRLEALENAAPTDSGSESPFDLSELEARVAALETGEPTPSLALDYSEALSALEQRLLALEGMTSNPDVEIKLADLGAKLAEKDTALSSLMARVDTLETGLQATVEAVDLSSIDSRLSVLEQNISSLEEGQTILAKASAPIPDFPSDAVIAALEAADVTLDGNWLERTFDKYVLADNAEAIRQVSRIENYLQRAEIEQALVEARKLPEPGLTAAQDWIDTVAARRP